MGDPKAAREYFEKSLQLREQLAQQARRTPRPGGTSRVSYDKLGNVSMQLGDLKAAREYFEEY